MSAAAASLKRHIAETNRMLARASERALLTTPGTLAAECAELACIKWQQKLDALRATDLGTPNAACVLPGGTA